MSEIISTYHLNFNPNAHPMDRDHFYKEQAEVFRTTGEPSLAVGIFDVILFTEQKEIILQKRSNRKNHNPYLIDKTVGGHIQYGDSPFYTAMIECVQEMRVPAIVLRQEENFKHTFEILHKSVENAAILELVDNNIYNIDNIINGERITFAKNIWMFVGIYGGPIKPVDREASGILYYELDTLRDEMNHMPELFTPDLHFMLPKYQKAFDRLFGMLD